MLFVLLLGPLVADTVYRRMRAGHARRMRGTPYEGLSDVEGVRLAFQRRPVVAVVTLVVIAAITTAIVILI